MGFQVSEGVVLLLSSCLGRSTSHVVWAFPLQVQQLPFPGSMMEQTESDLNFCLGPFHFNLWLCRLRKLDWLVPGRVPVTGLVWKDFVVKGGKEKAAQILELRVTPYLPADVELGTRCAAAATSLFSSLGWISTRLLPLWERKRQTWQRLEVVQKLVNTKRKNGEANRSFFREPLLYIGTSFLLDFGFEKNWDRRSSVMILGFFDLLNISCGVRLLIKSTDIEWLLAVYI